MAHRDTPTGLEYKVRWYGYTPADDTFETAESLYRSVLARSPSLKSGSVVHAKKGGLSDTVPVKTPRTFRVPGVVVAYGTVSTDRNCLGYDGTRYRRSYRRKSTTSPPQSKRLSYKDCQPSGGGAVCKILYTPPIGRVVRNGRAPGPQRDRAGL